MIRSIQILVLFSIVTLASTGVWAHFGPSPEQVTTPVSQRDCYNDSDGDGICDVCGDPVGSHRKQGKGRGQGPGDGSGNQGQGPKDGTGYGSGSGRGSGDCDGTGPHGNRGGRGNGGGRGGRR